MNFVSPILAGVLFALSHGVPAVDEVDRRLAPVQSAEDLVAGGARTKVRIQSRVGGKAWSSKRGVYPLLGEELDLRVRGAAQGGEIRWYLIFADLRRNYQNANHPWEEDPYKWTGIEPVTYMRVELTDLRGKRSVSPFEEGLDLFARVRQWFRDNDRGGTRLDFYNGLVGTFWFQVEQTRADGIVERTPGIEADSQFGLSPKTFRVSVRGQSGYLGYLTSFYNVAGVFGSVPGQSRNHMGADCADVLMAAWFKWKGRKLDRNFNVQALVQNFPTVAEFDVSAGSPLEQIEWGKAVKPGDFIAVKYSKAARKYQHIGALHRDTNGDGILDAEDSLLHAGPDPLHETSLSMGGFDGHVVILRPRRLAK